MMEIYREFTFDAAHRLRHCPVGHKCRGLHGHTFRVQVWLRGPLDPDLGWIVDFNDIKTAVQPLIDQLDHQLLNDIHGLDNPTSEHLAIWLWDRLKPTLPQISKIVVQETPSCAAVYTGPDA